MSGRETRIDEEARQLWLALHGCAPPADLSGSDLLLHVLELMDCGDYERLGDANSRGRQITWPH